MKKKGFFFLAIIFSHTLMAQRVGIGITVPLAPLHISTGASGNLTPFSPLVVESNSNTYINLLSPNTSETGVLFGKADNAASGAIVYNNVNTLNGFQFRTGGNITQMILNNAGNLGIGLSTPNAKLSISANGTALTGTALGNTFTTNAGNLGSYQGDELTLANIGFLSSNSSSLGIRAYRNYPGTDWTSVALLLGYDVDNNANAGGYLALAANGNLGIGMPTPYSPLTFNNILGEKISLFGNVNNNYGIGIQSNLLQIHSDGAVADIALGYGSSESFTERMRIKGNGNVGIGTTAPAAKLHVSAGDASLSLFGPNSSNGKLYVGAAPNQALASTAQVLTTDGNLHLDPAPGKNMFLGYYQARDIHLNPNGGNVIIGGNVGIGNSTPGFPLSFAQVTGDKISLYGNSGAHYGFGVQGYLMQIHTSEALSDIAFGYGSSSSFTETMRIQGNGNVGIGTTAPTAKLEVNGYTKLGNDAPSIKVKKLTGTTAATQGSSISLALGVDPSKILSVSVTVLTSYGALYGPNVGGSGVHFYWYVSPNLGTITVGNVTGDSVYLLSRPIKILITYEE